MTSGIAQRPSTVELPSHCEFKAVRHNSERMNIVTDIFRRVLAPIYGDQTDAVQKIVQAKDRTCRMLYEKDSPKGIIVYKDMPNDECALLGGVRNSLELKTLLVIDPEKNSGKGLGSLLLKHQIFNKNSGLILSQY